MPVVAVVGIVTDLHKRKVMVLLMPREVEPYKGKWSLPIFHIDRYESVKDAVQREVKEMFSSRTSFYPKTSLLSLFFFQ